MKPRTSVRYGNCFFGALWLRVCCGGRLRKLRQKDGPGHWVCKLPDGEIWHFRRTKDVLPRPWSYLLFRGVLCKLQDRVKQPPGR